MIACEPLRDVVSEFVALHGDDQEKDAWQLLADAMGYKDARSAQSTIPRVLAREHLESGRSDFDAIDWADRLLVAVGAVHLWHELDDEPQAGQASDQEHDATCAGCGRMIDWNDPADLAVRVELGQTVTVRKRWCWFSLCAVCFAETGVKPAPRPDCTGKIGRRIPGPVLLGLYRAYATERVGLERLVETARLPERYGFPNVRAAATSVTHAWRDWGWPMYDRATANRLNRRAQRASGKVRGRIPADDLRRLNILHTRGKRLSANELARRTYQRYGYKTHVTCQGAILNGWKALGLRSRDRIEMTVEMSLVDGLSPRNWQERKRRRLEAGLTMKGKPRRPECVGSNKRGKRCTRPAMPSGYCWSHDPDREAERQAQLAAMRERSPIFNRPLTDWEPVRQELLAAGEWLGSYEPIAEAMGLAVSSVKKYASHRGRRVSVEKAAQFRAAIAAVTTPVVELPVRQTPELAAAA